MTIEPDVRTDDPEAPAALREAGHVTGRTGRNWRALRLLLLRLHFYAGVLIAPFLLVAAVTGLIYTTMPQVESIVYRHELTVPVGHHRIALADQVAAARRAHPEGTLTAVRPARTPEGTTRVILSVPGLPDSYARNVFVDPYTGDVRGAEDNYGEWLPLRAWFDNLHRTLHMGDVGRVYSELAASWLWVIVLAGVVLWISRRRRDRRARRLLLPRLHPQGRSRLLSWHGSVGIWAVVGFLFLSATGSCQPPD